MHAAAAPTASAPEIMRVLVLSTAHLSRPERDLLTLLDAQPPTDEAVACMRAPEGVLIALIDREDVEQPLPADDWPGLADCTAYARSQDCAYLRFDTDGPVQAGLRVWGDA